MTNTEYKEQIMLLALAMLSLMMGVVLLEIVWMHNPMPAWSLLPIFFSAAMLFKIVELLQKGKDVRLAHSRVVTVEYRWNSSTRRNTYGYIC